MSWNDGDGDNEGDEGIDELMKGERVDELSLPVLVVAV